MVPHLLPFVAGFALVWSCLAGRAQEATARRDAPEKVFVGYVYRPPAKLNFKLYTHLCHAFITADENGVVRTNRNVPSRELVEAAHGAGVKVLLSLGGWGWD